MAEWLYEAGIGENRAALIEDGHILEAAIELPGEMRVGSVLAGRLTSILIPGHRGIVETAAGEVLVEPLPASLSQGRSVRVGIVREAIPELGKAKLAKGQVTDADEREGASLAERIGVAATRTTGPDRFEEAGWSELLEEAACGEIAFPGGALRMSLTPAMTLFDVDGSLPATDLAAAGAQAAAGAIRRFGIGGSIGIDLPTLTGKAGRQRAAAALDAVLPQPFERTAVNGFGFLQIVRRRERASLPELLQGDPVGAAARALLRRAERLTGPVTLIAVPAVIARMQTAWTDELARRTGGAVGLRADPALTTSAGHVHAR